jgi:hypothetical protein
VNGEEKENDREADGRRGMEFRTDDRIARGRPGEEEVVCVCVCVSVCVAGILLDIIGTVKDIQLGISH